MKNFLKKLLILAFWLLVWQLLSLVVNSEIILPSIPEVLNSLGTLAVTSEFWFSILLSLARILAGLLLGIVVGFLLAAVSCKVSFVRELFAPVISVARSTPVASFIILFLVWIKKDWVPVFIVFLIVMPVVFQNIFEGLQSTPKSYLETAKIYNLTFPHRVKFIYRRTLESSVRSALITSFGLAWKSGVAAEVLAVPVRSIGYNIYRSKINIETDKLFAWTIVVILISCFFEFVIKRCIGGKKHDKV